MKVLLFKKQVSSLLLIWMVMCVGFMGIFLESEEVRAVGPTEVSGIISMDTIWTLTNSPYIVTGNVIVEIGAILTIEPGVEVKFDGEYYIFIDGSIVAEGNKENNIIFTSNKENPTREDWQYIKIRESSGNKICVIKYCEIKYAKYGLYCEYGTSPTIENSLISNNNNHGIFLEANYEEGCSPQIILN